uniref:Uncharacterized protein n=1 Tax=Lotus japonicus TaxID=34305 RepID=I3SWT1_LOTJA|nr:unknown [Lotus japonicus]
MSWIDSGFSPFSVYQIARLQSMTGVRGGSSREPCSVTCETLSVPPSSMGTRGISECRTSFIKGR